MSLKIINKLHKLQYFNKMIENAAERKKNTTLQIWRFEAFIFSPNETSCHDLEQ